MPSLRDPSDVRALAERLVAIPSASPDPAGETAVAHALRDALPGGVEHGEWPTPDGRPIVWARVRGRIRRTTVLLGHTDTVGADEFAALGAARGVPSAFDPAGLRAHFLAPGFLARAPAAVLTDLQEERIAPGTWMFGRGALDMKGGLAAAVAALARLASPEAPPAGDVLFVACPDEEHESRGMLAAVEALAGLREREGLEFSGAINLDYTEAPEAFAGVTGKVLLGVYALGVPAHAAAPFAGVDAAQMIAALVSRLSAAEALVDAGDGRSGVPPVALRMRDLKSGYNLQTPVEAVAELNVVSLARPVEETLARAHAEAEAALGDLLGAMRTLARHGGWTPAVPVSSPDAVMTYGELVDRARAAAGGSLELPPADGDDLRAASLERVRRLARIAGLRGPAVVLYLMPPFYPAAAPGDGPLVRAARRVLDRAGVPLRAYYPFVSDSAYLAWRSDASRTLAAQVPVWGVEYRLPIAAMRALDLDVVNLGPWGRDAHGLFERAHGPWTFGRLPALLAEVAAAAGAEG